MLTATVRGSLTSADPGNILSIADNVFVFLHAKTVVLMRTSETQFPAIPNHIISLWYEFKEGRRVVISFETVETIVVCYRLKSFSE